jgi:hypothetical protein
MLHFTYINDTPAQSPAHPSPSHLIPSYPIPARSHFRITTAHERPCSILRNEEKVNSGVDADKKCGQWWTRPDMGKRCDNAATAERHQKRKRGNDMWPISPIEAQLIINFYP